MLLLLTHPEVASRSCEDCQKYVYIESTGQRQSRDGAGKFPILRGDNPPPCRGTKGCPKGTPEESKALSTKNLLAYGHYVECRAINYFPDDSIVRRNARIIYQLESTIQQHQSDITPLFAVLGRVIGGGGKRR